MVSGERQGIDAPQEIFYARQSAVTRNAGHVGKRLRVTAVLERGSSKKQRYPPSLDADGLRPGECGDGFAPARR
jgi:hypothetical protein